MVIRRYSYEGLITEVITTDERNDGSPERFKRQVHKDGKPNINSRMKEEAQEGLKEYFERIHNLIDFAIEQNSLRDHYNRKLYTVMDKIGDHFWNQFEYISVYRQISKGKKGELLGTWRLDSAPYEKVRYPSNLLSGSKLEKEETLVVQRNEAGERGRPEYITQGEWYLSKPGQRIRFQRPAVYTERKVKVGTDDVIIESGKGRIAEISALAMRERSGLETNIIVMTHLVMAAIDQSESYDFNTKGQFFYGTVDDPSFVAKRGLTVQKYNKETPNGWVLTDEPIEKDGMKLYVVGGSLEDIIGMVDNIRKGYDKMTETQQGQVRQFLRSLMMNSLRFEPE